ncbi:MAG: RNA-guided pseudouridylation complex pseudouridine synthase subunit Cbf5 [Candidatus Poseidoniaceae archaeon]|nr:RNA-guided pseudouridylation complex pseudouridine synthase subunit Cbf5 [Candidatus Thalassarchaeaceae archaeon]MDP6863974.1 RNA-guided pseudouridylation complex pseudouridine synthase subunit Cbf5 [Candidatus Poseidoniaceae archaeon]
MIILESNTETSAEHGSAPDARTIDQLLEGGFILLDKAPGPSSHQVSAWARDMFGLEKLGHGGTLDPFATGVLPLLAGKAMRLTGTILTHDKTYLAILKVNGGIDRSALDEAMPKLTGKVYNVPPEISAVRVQVRTRTISEFKILDVEGELVLVSIKCEAGTYVRTMARDLGLLLNTTVELKELRRPSSGEYSLAQSVTMQQIADAYWLWKERGDETAMRRILHPVETLLKDIPIIVVKDGAAAALSHGAPLLRPGLVSIAEGLNAKQEVQILTQKGEVVALAQLSVNGSTIQEMKQGEVAKPHTVLMKQDTYPRSWKK